jgi:hypothetical protein
MYAAFLDELYKVAASKGRMRVSQSRSGRRPMRVSTMLRKEKEGSLYKDTKLAHKLQGKTDVRGIPIAIENAKGSVRKGVDEDGHKWRTKYKVPYGYIEGTKGADNEEIDAYVGGFRDADEVHVVHQKKEDGSYDEDTVMLGFKDKAHAKKTIHEHYDDPKHIGSISTVPMDRFREMLGKGKKLSKISAVQGPSVNDSVTQPEPQVGKPASGKKKPGDVPSRDEPSSRPKVESTQTNQATTALVTAIGGGGYY